MSTFLYSYKGSSTTDELRYSLRSLHANYHGPIDQIVIVSDGDLPGWVDPGQVTHIKNKDFGDKNRNIIANVMMGATALYDLDRVIYMDDDYMLLDPMTEILPTHRGSLRAHAAQVQEHHGFRGYYGRRFKNTLDVLFDNVPTELIDLDKLRTFETHRPLPFNPRALLKTMEITQAWSRSDRDLPYWRTLYGNLGGRADGAVYARDGRSYGALKAGIPWASTHVGNWDKKPGQQIRELFEFPSPWEL